MEYDTEKESISHLTSEMLLEQIRIILKDELVATVRKAADELKISFPGGEVFRLTVWRESPCRGKKS